LWRTAVRTSKVGLSFTDSKKDFPTLKKGAQILVATDAETMVQEAGGHDGFPSLKFWSTTMKET
jgi:hypothetical protein